MNLEPTISIVSPVYKAEKIVGKLVEEIQKVMLDLKVSYEIILVDDRSPDNSWHVIKNLATAIPEVRSVRLSRNFGQHPAIIAGLNQARGEWIVVMDCDLQDQPKEIVKLYRRALGDYDIVLASRKNRQDGFLKKTFSRFFSIVYSYLTETKFDNTIANFGIYNKKVIDEVIGMNDYIKSFPLFVNWVGYHTASVEVEHAERESGKSSYSYAKLFNLAFDTIISFSNKPLKLFVKFGMTISILSVIIGIVIIYQHFTGKIAVTGYSSIIVSIWFLSGAIITTIGIVGIYIGKLFDQSKGRKSYIVDQIIE